MKQLQLQIENLYFIYESYMQLVDHYWTTDSIGHVVMLRKSMAHASVYLP